jgi:LysM repeat protein
VRTDTLARANNIKNPDHIQAGQRLHIPKDAPPPARAEAIAPGKGIAGVGKTPPSPIRTGQTPAPPKQPSLEAGASAGKKWKAKDASVKVPSSIRAKVDQVAEDYHAATGRTLTVTDGARTPQDQAERMYYKFSHGDFRTYKGPQAAQIADAYRQGKTKGKSRSQILSDMSAIIDRHNRNGQPVSKHLLSRGVDFRTRDMTAAQQAALEDAVKKHGGKIRVEGIPPHTHASF